MRIYNTSRNTYVFITDSGSQDIAVEECGFLEVGNSNCNMI